MELLKRQNSPCIYAQMLVVMRTEWLADPHNKRLLIG